MNPKRQFTFALWTAKMVRQIISEGFGVKMSKSSVCRLLSQLGLTPQPPVWRAYQQRPEEVQRWLQQEYPQIRRMAKKHNALIYFGDEAGERSDRAVKGKTPVVSSSARGEFRFITVKGRVGAAQFTEFIKRLLHNAQRMVFLIVDGHPAHKAKMVNAFANPWKIGFVCFCFLRTHRN